ncbi:unnamed protein product [Ambrosiozyma monospora]|uniref:Unnamed protein product n=1 Tax=Ambrosiozyma monospora TaxID=43982 RepID=A0ACB5SSY3_AMBMO|nr:unnamed protein product [Ambrosiozyma monospora]
MLLPRLTTYGTFRNVSFNSVKSLFAVCENQFTNLSSQTHLNVRNLLYIVPSLETLDSSNRPFHEYDTKDFKRTNVMALSKLSIALCNFMLTTLNHQIGLEHQQLKKNSNVLSQPSELVSIISKWSPIFELLFTSISSSSSSEPLSECAITSLFLLG